MKKILIRPYSPHPGYVRHFLISGFFWKSYPPSDWIRTFLKLRAYWQRHVKAYLYWKGPYSLFLFLILRLGLTLISNSDIVEKLGPPGVSKFPNENWDFFITAFPDSPTTFYVFFILMLPILFWSHPGLSYNMIFWDFH